MVVLFGLLVFGCALLGVVVGFCAVVWYSGGAVLRVVGLVLILGNVYRLVLAVVLFPWFVRSSLVWLGVGVVLWLGGHWVYAARWGCWRSGLAARVYSLRPLAALAPGQH